MAEEVNLFLDGIFSESCSSPSKVKLTFSEWTGNASKPSVLCGLLASEPTITTQNKWGPIISNISELSDLSSLMGAQSMFTWIGASVMCWKGTSPLMVSLDFYLINYKRGLRLEEGLTSLTKLTSMSKIEANNVVSQVAVAVHGGYAANTVLNTNASMFDNSYYVDDKKSNSKGNALNRISEFGHMYLVNGEAPQGTLSVSIGNRVSLSNLLVTRIDTTPSTAEVEEGKALFYRVNMSLTGARPLLSTDVDNMFSKG